MIEHLEGVAVRFPGLTKLTAAWDSLRTSYWFVPTLMAASSVGLWISVHLVDLKIENTLLYRFGWIYSGGPDGARELLSVVAGSMITVTGVTFSITIVALALASQQFGPFLLRNFMRDTGNQVVLGTFLSTFLYCLLTLRVIRGTETITYVPHLSVSVAMLLTLASLGVLIYFIHHVSMFIQVANMIAVVSSDLQEAIARAFPEEVGAEAAAATSSAQSLPAGFDEDTSAVTSSGYGYIKALDDGMLVATAVEHGLVIRLLKRPGSFVGEGDSIARVWPGSSLNREVAEAINDSFLLGSQRTATQDVEFVFYQIVEIAVRSLSPGINDPFTAMICIDHLGQGLRRMARRRVPSPFRVAEDGALRVIAYGVTFPELADTAFNDIRHYGRSSGQVLNRLLTTIAAVAPHATREEDRQALLRHALLIRETARKGVEDEAELSGVEQNFGSAVAALGDEGNISIAR